MATPLENVDRCLALERVAWRVALKRGDYAAEASALEELDRLLGLRFSLSPVVPESVEAQWRVVAAALRLEVA